MIHSLRLALLPASALVLALGCHSDSDYQGGNGFVTQAVAVADLDGTGGLDVLSVNDRYIDGNRVSGFLTTRLQKAGAPGTFVDPLRVDSGAYPLALAVGDLNGDGRPDVAVAAFLATSGTRAVNVHLQTTTAGVFQAPVSLSVGTRRPLDVTLADLTGQGQLDVVVAASGGNDVLVFLHGATPGTFLAPLALPVSGDPAAVAVGDLTGTGTKDIAVAMANGKVAILRQGATPGTFQAAVEYVMGWDPVAIRIADINGDGRQDLLTANYTQGGGGLSVLLQSAVQPGHFLPEQTFDTGDDACAGLAVGDVNGDGLPDIVVANAGLPGWPGSVSVFLQDPRTIANGETQIHLKAPDLYRGYYGPLSVVIADLKGDGHPALVIADGSPSIRWPDPASPGHFQPPVWLKQ